MPELNPVLVRALDRGVAAIGDAAARRLRDPRSAAERWNDLVVNEVGVRRLRWSDGPAWVAGMSSLEDRMRPWLQEVPDWESVAGPRAFRAHLRDAERRWLRGSGLALALTQRDTLVGEVGFWQTSSTHQTYEVGLWARRSGMSAHDRRRALGATLDRMFAGPLEQLHAPVSVGNTAPVAMLHALSFAKVARIPAWRPVGTGLGDFDLYSLSKTKWRDVRELAAT